MESLGDLFIRVSRSMRAGWRDLLAPFDIAPHHLRALRVLARSEPARPSTLACELGISARSATEVVDALVERDLASREPDPSDRRATLVRLTDAGRDVAHRVAAARSADADHFFDVLAEADRTALRRILHSLDRADRNES